MLIVVSVQLIPLVSCPRHAHERVPPRSMWFAGQIGNPKGNGREGGSLGDPKTRYRGERCHCTGIDKSWLPR